ncbi:MAG TPA: NifU family protein [Polyangiaceae bacterium]|nr:NifU family protein [Polyangiaceae bacterium]
MSSPREALDRVVRELIGPLLRADGGEIYLVSLTESSVSLHFAGRYSGCPGNTLVRRRVIEPVLQAAAPDVQITITSGVLVPAGAEKLS